MYKYISLLFLVFGFGFDSTGSTGRNFVVNINPTITSVIQDETDEIVLDKNEICSPCPPGERPNEDSDCDINMMIEVSAVHFNDRNFHYNYTVSGGRIIGEGGKVSWDLTGAQPGTYQISIDIENKLSGLQKKETKLITFAAQDCGGVCVCPTLSVVAPVAPTKAGETMTFTANASGGSGEMITYDWVVSDGEIIEGQGTPVIKVATNVKMAGKTIKATLEIGGVCEACVHTAEAVGVIAKPKSGKK